MTPGRKTRVGLRIDVDTLRGTRDGVPRLLEIFARHRILASFFFTVGPDNMGRHLWRLARPAFLRKMLRSRAASLYGWDILFRGTVWPGPRIGRRLAPVLRATGDAGHEIGLHAWDHHAWQMKIERMDGDAIHRELKLGFDELTGILGREPTCSAVAGWRCNERVLVEKERFPFRYNSDCRGTDPFRPVVDGVELTPQVPVTLPTYDEVVGTGGVTNENFNDHVLERIRPDRLNVLTIHAEVEGIRCAGMFDRFVRDGHDRGIEFVPLGDLLPEDVALERGAIRSGEIPGREGWVCRQAAS
jgi:undecaprenyl phosphate-alpha-L-ara4FN deformylase